MWRRVKRSQTTTESVNAELIAMESSTEDLDTNDGVASLLRRKERPVTQFQLSVDQQERLKLIENWREQDERLYPTGYGRRRSSNDNILEIPVIPVFKLYFRSFDVQRDFYRFNFHICVTNVECQM